MKTLSDSDYALVLRLLKHLSSLRGETIKDKNMARKAGVEAARIAAFGFAVCAVFFGWAFTRSSLFREDLLMNVPAYSEKLADFLDSHCNDGKILMDSYRGYYVIMNMDEPEN